MFDKHGRIVVNPSSTIHVPESNVTEHIDDRNVVEETHTRVTSASYTKRPKALRWTKDETYTFYMGLRQYGTSFGIIAQMFPGRERRHIKNKYNREERSHPELVTLALKNALPMKVNELAGNDLSNANQQSSFSSASSPPSAKEAGNANDKPQKKITTTAASATTQQNNQSKGKEKGKGKGKTKTARKPKKKRSTNAKTNVISKPQAKRRSTRGHAI